MNALWNAPISDRFSSLCARVFSPAAAILESEKTLGTRLKSARIRNSFLVLLGCPFERYDLGTTSPAAAILESEKTLGTRLISTNIHIGSIGSAPGTQRTKTIADWCIPLRVHTCALIGSFVPKQRWLPFEGFVEAEKCFLQCLRPKVNRIQI